MAKLHASGATYSAIIGKAREPTVAVRNAGRFECINDVNDMVMIFLEILLVVPFLGIEFKFRNFSRFFVQFLCGTGEMGTHTHDGFCLLRLEIVENFSHRSEDPTTTTYQGWLTNPLNLTLVV